MAIIRAKEAAKLNGKEIDAKMGELKKELLKLNSQVSAGATPENPGKIRAIKRTIGKLMFMKSMEVKQK